MPPVSNSVPDPARLLHMDLTLGRLQPAGATSAPPSCTGAQLPAWSNLNTNMREQPMRPAKHPSTVLCLCPTRPCAQSASPAPSRRSVLLGLASRLGISTRSLGVDEHAFVFDELIELDLHGHTPVAQSDAIRRNQTQSGAIRRNPTQSDAIRRNQTQSDAIRRNPTQSDAIRAMHLSTALSVRMAR